MSNTSNFVLEDHFNTETKEVQLSQSLIKKSFEDLNSLLENSKHGHRGLPKDLLRLWYDVRINAMNMCLNDHLSQSDLDYSDYDLNLIHEGGQYFVVVNGVLRFKVEAEDLTEKKIRSTVIMISAKCISQGGLVCSLK